MITLNGFMVSQGEIQQLTLSDSLKNILPSITWYLPLLRPLIFILLQLLFRPCLFNLLIKFVSSRSQQFHIKMTVLQRLKLVPSTETTLEGDIDPLDQAGRDFQAQAG